MLNISKSYAKIWEIEDKGNYVAAKIGTSRKDKRNDTYINSTFFTRFVGQATDLARQLQKGDKITITNGILESIYDKEKQKTWTTLTVFEFEVEGKQEPQGQGGFTPVDSSDPLPF